MSFLPKKVFDDDFWNDFMPSINVNEAMKCDIYEKGNKTFIEMDIPGFKKDDIGITMDDKYLTITAKREDSHEDKDKNYIRKERSYGQFSRSFYVGNVSEDEIEAEFKDGILTVSIPKEQKEQSKKQITIK
jgi:HSP20 family protein